MLIQVLLQVIASDLANIKTRKYVIYTKNVYLIKRNKLDDLKSVKICTILTGKRGKNAEKCQVPLALKAAQTFQKSKLILSIN